MNPAPSNPLLPLEIDVVAVHQLIEQQAEFLLLDCREPDEYQVCQIEGSVLIPMNETPGRLDDLGHREQRIVVYCHAGVRSHQVARWLRSQGFPNAQSMAGGIDQWSLQVDPNVPRY